MLNILEQGTPFDSKLFEMGGSQTGHLLELG